MIGPLALGLLAGLVCSTAAGAIALQRTDIPLSTVAAPNGPNAFRLGNLDGKNGLDIVVALRATNEVAVILSQGGDAFSAPVKYAPCTFPIDVEVGDVVAQDGGVVPDGLNDVVVGCVSGAAGTVVLLPGNGAGGVGSPVTTALAVGNGNISVSPEKPDLVTLARLRTNPQTPVLVVRSESQMLPMQPNVRGVCTGFDFRLAKGPCTYPATTFMRGPMVAANINGGPYDQILMSGVDAFGSPPHRIGLTGWQADTFPLDPWTGFAFRPGGNDPVFDLAAADIEPDGDLDVLVGRQVNLLTSPVDSIGIFRWNAGTGLALAPEPVPSIPQLTSLAVGNLDGDGKPDLVAAGGLRRVVLHPGLGGGGFGPPEPLATGLAENPLNFFEMTVQTGDVSGDGQSDLVLLDTASATVQVFRNVTPLPITPGPPLTPGPGPVTPVDLLAPVARGLTVTTPRGRRPRPSTARFRLLEPAFAVLKLQKRVVQKKKPKFIVVKTLTRSVKAGPNVVSLGTLTPGRYTLTVTTTDVAKNTGIAKKTFVVRPRR